MFYCWEKRIVLKDTVQKDADGDDRAKNGSSACKWKKETELPGAFLENFIVRALKLNVSNVAPRVIVFYITWEILSYN